MERKCTTDWSGEMQCVEREGMADAIEKTSNQSEQPEGGGHGCVCWHVYHDVRCGNDAQSTTY